MKKLEQAVEALATGLHYVAGAAVFCMMVLTFADVILRKMRMPIPGAYDLVSIFGGMAVAFAMAHTTLGKGHVAVSIIVRRLPKAWQNILDGITSLLGCIVFCLATWTIIMMGRDYQTSGHVTMTLHAPMYIMAYAMAAALFAVCLALLVTAVKHFGKAAGKWG